MEDSREAVIITGSSGLIGSALAGALGGYRVFGLDLQPPEGESTVEFLEVDLTSDDSVAEVLAEVGRRHDGPIASVVHLAAYYDFGGDPSPLYDTLTVGGTERLLRGVRDLGAEQFLFSSTMLVHASCELGQRIDEDWPLEPKWPYPESKVRAEEVIVRERGNMPAVRLRIAGVYDDECHSPPLAHQIQRIYERKLVSKLYPGSPEHGQAFIHLDDLVSAMVRIIERRQALPEDLVLLLGEEETLGYGEMQEEFGRLIHGEPWETHEIPKALAKTGAWLQDQMPGEDPWIKPFMVDLADDHYALDIGRARRLLDWGPRRTLRGTLPNMVTSLRENTATWYRENKLEPAGVAGSG